MVMGFVMALMVVIILSATVIGHVFVYALFAAIIAFGLALFWHTRYKLWSDAVPTDSKCKDCGSEMTLSYGQVQIYTCPKCGYQVNRITNQIIANQKHKYYKRRNISLIIGALSVIIVLFVYMGVMKG